MVKEENMKVRRSRGERIFEVFNYIFLSVIMLACLYPVWYVMVASFSDSNLLTQHMGLLLKPPGLSFDAYKKVFQNPMIMKGYMNTLFILIVGVILDLIMTSLGAYFLSRKRVMFKKPIMMIIIFTMFFSGGMIPSYINISNLHLMNTFWVMVLPGALSVYNMIVTRTFIQTSIPYEMLEAASIDGCNDTKYFFSFVLPLSKAIIAVNTLFSAVNHWNTYFNAMIYLNDRDKLPLQNIMRELLVLNEMNLSDLVDPEQALLMLNSVAVLKYALIVVATVPILCAYPFAQKYFVKGVMIGSVKG